MYGKHRQETTHQDAIIRELHESDVDSIMQIWLENNLKAHDFIPASYWKGQFDHVRKMIPASEVYVYEISKEIAGFIGLIDNYIAGIFVARKFQSRGIGKQLLDHVKSFRSGLHLHVYQKNNRAVRFYQRENFAIVSENRDEHTGETEFLMKSGR